MELPEKKITDDEEKKQKHKNRNLLEIINPLKSYKKKIDKVLNVK